MKRILLLLSLFIHFVVLAQEQPVQQQPVQPQQSPVQEQQQSPVQTQQPRVQAPIRTQAPPPVVEKEPHTLKERFYVMKSKSESFRDYKVIREYVLDGVWKIFMDSLNTEREALRTANATITQLQSELTGSRDSIQQKEASMAEIIYDSTHIKVLGINLYKGAFISTVGIILLLFLAFIGVIFIRLRWVQNTMREKTEIADVLSHEFEEYKRHALDKQMRLSRELQNERNKLQELGSS